MVTTLTAICFVAQHAGLCGAGFVREMEEGIFKNEFVFVNLSESIR
jgi:hypothetical protein